MSPYEQYLRNIIAGCDRRIAYHASRARFFGWLSVIFFVAAGSFGVALILKHFP